MRWRLVGLGAVCGLFLAIAGTVLLLQVRVHRSGLGASCGAPFDVITGRADWQTWYADDLTDPRLTVTTPLVRTEACPAAVNHRTALAGALGAVGITAGVAAIVIARARHTRSRPTQLRTLGTWVTAIGVALTTAGLVGLVVLLANPHAAVFLYVRRWVVAIIGVIVLIPAIALAAGGRALMLFAETRDERPRTDDEIA